MTVHPISAFLDNYIWVIVNPNKQIFDCVDPGDSGPVLEFAYKQKMNLRSILLTHHHEDHIGGVADLVKSYPLCAVYGPLDSRISYINHFVTEHQEIPIEPWNFKILSNPGHTSSHISYYEFQQGWLFCGDTLFSAGCGRVFDGTLEQLHQSLNLFKTLPPKTKIFCAHEYTKQNLRFSQAVEPNNLTVKNQLQELMNHPDSITLPSTLEHELLINPFLRTNEPDVINFAQLHGAISNESSEVFRILREQKNNFK